MNNRTLIILFAAAALLAGLWWVPIRILDAIGFAGAWAIVAMGLGALPCLLAASFFRGGPLISAKSAIGAWLIGLAIVFYSASLTETTVLNALLFFYIAPIWSILIEIGVLKRRIPRIEAIVIFIVIGGIIAVNADMAVSLSFNRGDVIAVLSGMFFAAGAACAFSAGSVDTSRFFMHVTVACCVSGALAAFAMRDVTGWDRNSATSGIAILTVLACGLVFFAPVVWITGKASMTLAPSLVTVFLALEIVSGFISSVIWAEEALDYSASVGLLAIVLGIGVLGLHNIRSSHKAEQFGAKDDA